MEDLIIRTVNSESHNSFNLFESNYYALAGCVLVGINDDSIFSLQK